jgi:predicted TIM-barrel fold metal-dependent hydrolase
MNMSTAEENQYTFDFGGHVHPEAVAPPPIRELDEYVGRRHTDVDELVRWYERAGFDGAALSQPFYMGQGDTDAVAEANDVLLEEIESRSEFYGLAAIPTAAGGNTAAAELERCLDEGYSGGALETNSDGIELVNREVEPVLDVADKTGVPLLVHPKLDDSLGPAILDDTYRLNAIFGREIALARSICKVIHEGVFERYPNLTLVYHHLGGNLASMLGRIHVQLDAGRWPGQDETLDYDEFEAVLRDQVYVDTSGFFGDAAPLRATLDDLPAEHVLFGADVPYEPRSTDEIRGFASTVQEVAAQPELVLGENARSLLS